MGCVLFKSYSHSEYIVARQALRDEDLTDYVITYYVSQEVLPW